MVTLIDTVTIHSYLTHVRLMREVVSRCTFDQDKPLASTKEYTNFLYCRSYSLCQTIWTRELYCEGLPSLTGLGAQQILSLELCDKVRPKPPWKRYKSAQLNQISMIQSPVLAFDQAVRARAELQVSNIQCEIQIQSRCRAPVSTIELN